MSYLRRISTRRLLGICAAVVFGAGALAAIAIAATGGGPKPAPKPLAQAVRDALTANPVAGVTARISFTNHLIDAASLQGTDPILTGASGRLWATNDRLRLELQASPDRGTGDVQVLVNRDKVTVIDSGSNTVYRVTLPADHQKAASEPVPSLAGIQAGIAQLATQATLSGARPSDVAGRPTYTVRIAPRHDGGLLGGAELAWDAQHGVPLRAAVYAAGAKSPVLELKATSISFGSVPASALDVPVPAGAKVVDLNPTTKDAHGRVTTVTGLRAVRAKAGFAVAAPARLVGLPREDVRLIDESGTPGALVTYGQGLGGIAVLETKASAHDSTNQGILGNLPKVSINGGSGQELDTALGTVVRFDRGGISYTVIGSIPPAAAEAAARGL